MADDEYDRFVRPQHYDALMNSKQRILREYDFFAQSSEKLKQVHVLPWPQNPDALQEFFLPELISPASKWMKTPVGKGKMVESAGMVIKNAEPLIPPAAAGVFLFGKRLDDSPATAGVFLFGKRLDDSPATAGHFRAETDHKDQELRSPLIVYNPTPLRSEYHHQMQMVPNPNPPKFHEKIIRGIQGTPVLLFDKKLEGLDTCHNRDQALKISPVIRPDSNKLMKTPKGKMVESAAPKEEALPPPPPRRVWLFDKRLQDSDLIPGLDRLLISESEKLMGFLSEGDRIQVESGGAVTVILELKGGVEQELELVLTKMEGSINEGVLLVKDDWGSFLSAQDLKVGDLLMGWGSPRPDDAKFRLKIFTIEGSLRSAYQL